VEALSSRLAQLGEDVDALLAAAVGADADEAHASGAAGAHAAAGAGHDELL
jgi:hypothetical protein